MKPTRKTGSCRGSIAVALDVEQIRDGLLAMDGTLDLTMGGTLQSGFGTDGENSSDRLSLDPEKINRRLVYIPLRRANLPGLLNLFDFGDATTSAGTRPRTNVAPQGLFMMNSEFIAARSRNLAEEFLKAYPNDPERRVEGRLPTGPQSEPPTRGDSGSPGLR